MFIFCKDNANERNESLLSNCRMQLILCKDNKKDDTMRNTNVKMWMNFPFSDRNVSDNEIDKKNGRYTKSGCGIDKKMRRNLHFFYIRFCRFRFFYYFCT